jgi:dipeptidyl aminopeptidase/acylaminoacyl peptidase
MSDPTWIGRSPETARWVEDGASVWYRRSLPELEGSEWVHIDLEGRELEVVGEERAQALFARGDTTRDGRRSILERGGDLFLLDHETGAERRLTRTEERESGPQFLADEGRIVFRRSSALILRDLADGFESQVAVLELGEEPKEDDPDEPEDFLVEQQKRLLDHVREVEERRKASKARADAARELAREEGPPLFYLGKDLEDPSPHLAPDGKSLIVRLSRKGGEAGKHDTMPRFVTASGLVETEGVRSKVGAGKRTGHGLVLLDLQERSRHELALDGLSGLREDPLAELRAGAMAFRKSLLPEDESEEDESAKADPEPPEDSEDSSEVADPGEEPKAAPEPEARPLSIGRIEWNDSGSYALCHARSLDNKDDWLLCIDARERRLIEVEHRHDEAWINRQLRDSGWIPDSDRIWYVSEATGWAQLYVHDVASGESTPLTRGEREVTDARTSRDGAWIYFSGNPVLPGRHELHRVSTSGGEVEALSELGGRNEAWLSPDESQWVILHSRTLAPPELYLLPNRPGAAARRLTSTVSEDFAAVPWVEPQVLAVPSRHERPIWSRLYLPSQASDPGPGARPAVLFVHGAGYLQNAHEGWSDYFREFMFHTLLAHRGYVVLDMDYRASAGYGRDWRTAIYRRMGEPELEDLADGVAWLVEQQGVDEERIGVYGGSYGGFLTLMALFKQPGLFACGAALRPVTERAHYNHGYTSNILNTPEVDPEAYWRSSPIEYAGGLADPLLMCHGMLDDNVFFQDTVRLSQRLIELGKRDWEVAMYPVEAHSFREPASWLDEYRRVLALLERHCGAAERP